MPRTMATDRKQHKLRRDIDLIRREYLPNLFDTFGRIRVSTVDTLFDSKMIADNLPLFWDDQEVSGSGTTSTYDINRAGVKLGVALNTAGKRVRQTFQRFNYQPGKSQLVYMTTVPIFSGGGSGIITEVGYGDDNNGIFFTVIDGVPSWCIRSKASGSVVDTVIAQDDWSNDRMTGTDGSKLTLDVTKSHILWIDLEWLGVGLVRCGFLIDGAFVLCHQFKHTNSINTVYMSHPNHPLRYSIANDGTGAATVMEQICSTVISEGGQDERASLHAITTGNASITPTAGDVVACIGIRLKTTHQNVTVDLADMGMLNANAQAFEWRLIYAPTTIAGTFVYSGVDNSAMETALGASDGSNIVTGGTLLAAGIGAGAVKGNTVEAEIDSAIRLGSTIAGVSDQLVLCVVTYAANADIDAALNWRERT